jgi:imidazolonepropionase-like amidohydrolase
MRRLVLLCSIACSSPAPKPAPPVEPITAIVDVTLVPMTPTGPVAVPHQTVLVWRDEILDVVPASAGVRSDVTRRIDGRGKWLIPGLVDAHVHTFDPNALAMFVSMGVTTVRVMWGFPQVLAIRTAMTRDPSRLAPSILTAGSIIDGKPPVWPGSTGLETAAEATAEVERQHRAGYDFIKPYAKLSPELYGAIVKEAAARKLPVMGHVPTDVGLLGVLEAKQKTIEHLDGYPPAVLRDDSPLHQATGFKARMAMLLSADPAKVRDMVARTKAAGTWNCPTLVVMDQIGKLEQPDLARPELRFVSKGNRALWDPKQDFRFKSWTAEDYKTVRDTNTQRGMLVKQLSDGGAGILAGTDVGNPWLVPGFSLHDELGLLVAAKLSPHEALRAATRSPAELFAGKFGTIERHQRADLVLLDADPLADISNTRKIAGVMLRGRWLPATELAAMREQVAAIYAGTRSRYADARPVTESPAFTARYISDAPQQAGEQRVAFARNRIHGDTRIDNDVPTAWEIDPGATGVGEQIKVTLEGGIIALSRNGGDGVITTSLNNVTSTRREKIEPDEVLAADPLAADALIYRRLASVEIDQTVTIKLAKLELIPEASVSHLALVLTRRADATRTVAGKSIPVRMFDVMVGFMKVEVAIDADGWPVDTTQWKRVD